MTRKTPPGAATRPDRVRPLDWFGYAATAVTGGLALAACRWTVTGSGYPFGPSDPLDAMSLLRGLPPGVGAPLFAGVLAVTAVAMLAMTANGGARPRGGARVGLLMVGWTAAVVLLVVVPDIRLLALTAYVPMLLLGAPFGWPDIDYGTIFTASLACQGASLLGGFLVAATVLVWQRRTRGGCARCGRTDATTLARWRPAAAGRWATGVAVAVPLLFAVTRYAWMVGVPLGIGEGALRHLQQTDGRWRGGGLATFAVIGAVLTLGLARPWGEVVPHWLPGLGGRRVPVAVAVVPVTFVALLVMSAGLGMMSNVGVFFDELGAQGWLVGIHALWPLWSLALGVAAYAYYLRRRGRCKACGRH